MKYNSGSTLIETLFAFSIYVTILILFMSLMTSGLKIQTRLYENNHYDKDVIISEEDTLEEIINKALP